MNIQKNTNNKTSIQNKQQSISRQKIINDIINILANNCLSISDSKNILYETSKVICKQKVMFSDSLSGWIDANNCKNI